MMICGIDPGVTGAMAFLSTTLGVTALEGVVSMPVISQTIGKRKAKKGNRRNYDWEAIAELLRRMDPELAIIEQQWARSNDGVASAFLTGVGYGGLLGIMVGMDIDYETVPASVWKPAMGLANHEKEASRQLALKLMPAGRALFARKMDHGRAEAALIALWRARRVAAAKP